MSYRLVKPLLFSLNPELAHHLTISGLAAAGNSRAPMPFKNVDDPVELMGLKFQNRVGLAAGLDKDGKAILGLQRLGFGFLELGTVTPVPQSGNPKPRMFRLPEHQAVINRMGFNNDGLAALLGRLQKARESSRIAVPIGVNIGKNKNTPAENAAEDYLQCLQGAAHLADYITINLSSPNTPGLRDLQFGEALEQLLSRLCSERASLEQTLTKRLPLLVKLAPDMAEEDLTSVADLAMKLGIDGLIISNTTVNRESVAGHKHAGEAGGLSGAPVFAPSTEALRTVANHIKPKKSLVLVGVGGIDSVEKGIAKIEAGADLVQIYTGMVYRGPSLIGKVAQGIKDASASR